MTRPTPQRLLASALALTLRGLVRAYQLGPAYFFQGSCRYDPSCSRYATEAIEVHGAIAGTWLAARRICRCHPWGGLGYDPVPSPARSIIARPADPALPHPGQLPAALPRASRPIAF